MARRVIGWGCARRSGRRVVDEQIVGRIDDLGRGLAEEVYFRQLQHLLSRQKALRPVLDFAILHEHHRGKAVDLGDPWMRIGREGQYMERVGVTYGLDKSLHAVKDFEE